MIGSDMFDIPALSGVSVEGLPEYGEVRHRFEEDFYAFMRRKKFQAIRQVIREELPGSLLSSNLMFLNQVANRVDDTAVVEKSYTFIALNPRLLV